jgi:hypothetical protein
MDPRQNLDEGYTEFVGQAQTFQNWFLPTGRLGRFYSKFFGTKAQPYLTYDRLKPPHPMAGDAVINREIIRPESDHPTSNWGINRNGFPIMPQSETNRKNRYREYEGMDTYPETGAAFDIYADECTQKNLEGDKWKVITEDDLAREEILALFEEINLDIFLWDIVRNTCKYGDCFIEAVIDLNHAKKGIRRAKILNPNHIFRVENEFGYLTDFLQEIPKDSQFDTYNSQSLSMTDSQFISLDKNQIIHFRLHTSNPWFYPYGKSIAAMCVDTFRTLKLMEDAMVVYRLSRAPERRIFYIDTGTLPASKSQNFVEKLKAMFKKEKYYNPNSGNIDARYNPPSMDEDFFVPIRTGSNTKIETLPGAQNLGEVDDVKYFRDKLLALLKIPKDYIVEKEQSPERKANLSQLDVKFARTVQRIQNSIEVGLNSIVRRHLQLKEFPEETIKAIKIELPEPSDMFVKRRLDVGEQQARVVQAVMGLGLFDKDYIYKTYYDMSEDEIEKMKEKVEKEQEEMAEQGMMQPGMGAPGMGGAPPMQPGMEQEPIAEPTEGGMESEENAPPTQNEDFGYLSDLRQKLVENGESISRLKIINRLIHKKTKKVGT